MILYRSYRNRFNDRAVVATIFMHDSYLVFENPVFTVVRSKPINCKTVSDSRVLNNLNHCSTMHGF